MTALLNCAASGRIAQSLYYTWSKEFMERASAGSGFYDTARAATTGEVQDLRREARALKEMWPTWTSRTAR